MPIRFARKYSSITGWGYNGVVNSVLIGKKKKNDFSTVWF